ncbi:hypothetical protein BDR06DRAFT_296761 [Suillus hirtellus]|nr:hypothetical protein BDR06DRAFT_296761 [Suillus hirtellus]
MVHRRLPYLLGERLNELSHIFLHFLHQIHGSADVPTDVDSALVSILGTSDVRPRGMPRLKLQNWPSKALVIFVSTSLIQVSAYAGMPSRFTFHFSEGLQERSILPFLCSASERIPEGMEAVRMGNISSNELEQKTQWEYIQYVICILVDHRTLMRHMLIDLSCPRTDDRTNHRFYSATKVVVPSP